MRAGLGEGGELAEARVRSARGGGADGTDPTRYRENAPLRGPRVSNFLRCRSQRRGGSVDCGRECSKLLQPNGIYPLEGVFRSAEHGVGGSLTECCPSLLVGPRWHYAPVHCERAHGHLDCRAPERDPVAAETESGSALCGISRPGAMNTRPVASRLGYPEHGRSGMRPCALWGRVPKNLINRMKTSVAATILHGIGRRPKRLRSVARHRRYTTRPCRSLSSGELCPTQ